MGNEMGNNNTTGLKEEESLAVGEPKGLSKESSHSFDDVKAENQVEEAKDFQEKNNGVASDHDIPQTPNREEKEQNREFLVVDSPEVGPDEEGNESSEIQQVSLPTNDEDEGLIELNMDEIVPNKCEDQPQKEASSLQKEQEEEEEGTTNTDFDKISIPSHDLEPIKTGSSECDQSELATIDAKPSEPDTKGLNVETEQVTSLSSICGSTENGGVSDTIVAENLEVSLVTETSTVIEKEIDKPLVEQNKEAEEEKFELEDGEKLENVLILMQPNDPIELEGKTEEVFSTEKNSIRDDSSESESELKVEPISQEVEESEAKSVLVSYETREKPCESQDSNAFQSDIINNIQPEEAKVSEDHEPKQIMIEEDSTEKRILEEEAKDSSEIEPLSDESTFSSIAEIIVSMNELAFESNIVKQCLEKPEPITSRESGVERLSTDSDRESVQYSQMRKSPSFSLDLQSEESEQTPLLFEDKATIETSRNCEEIVSYSLTLNGSGNGGEEKVVRLERSDSEKSKTPFLELLKEDEELVKPKKERESKAQKEAKNGVSSSTKVTISTTSTKGKEKRNKAKSSLFGNCMCCATMIN